MCRFIDFFRSTSRYANAIAFVAMTVWLAKVLWLDSIPGPFAKADILGEVVEITLSQVVASYVFYLFFVHMQELKDRKSVATYVRKHATRIYGDCQGALAEIANASGMPLDFDTVSEEEVKNAFAAVPTSSNPNMVIGPQLTSATWFQYFEHQKRRTDGSVKKVLALGRLVEPALANAIVVASDHHFLFMILNVGSAPISNPTLEVWGGSFFGYLEECRKIKHWLEANP